MAFNSEQMLVENIIENGIRGDIVVLSGSDEIPENYPGRLDYQRLQKQLENVFSWEQLKRACHTRQLNGNTKHSDLWILAGFFQQGLNAGRACEEIGYAIRHRPTGHIIASPTLYYRLKRINITSPYAVIEPFLEKELIPRDTVREALNKRGRTRGKFERYYAKWYVTSAVERFGDDMQTAADHIGVPFKTIQYWYDLEVEDIMVKPTLN